MDAPRVVLVDRRGAGDGLMRQCFTMPGRMILRKFRGSDEGRFKSSRRERPGVIAVEDFEAAADFGDSAADSPDSGRAADQTDSVPVAP